VLIRFCSSSSWLVRIVDSCESRVSACAAHRGSDEFIKSGVARGTDFPVNSHGQTLSVVEALI